MKSWTVRALVLATLLVCVAGAAFAQGTAAAPVEARSEANLVLPDLAQVTFMEGISGKTLLLAGLLVCVLGGVFGLVMYARLKNLPVHRSMLEISELIYETCKTYLLTQGKFIMYLWLFIGAIMVVYFGFLRHFDALRVVIILAASLVASPAATAWRGSASASTPSPTRAPRSRR